jgi:hypothetical protein
MVEEKPSETAAWENVKNLKMGNGFADPRQLGAWAAGRR